MLSSYCLGHALKISYLFRGEDCGLVEFSETPPRLQSYHIHIMEQIWKPAELQALESVSSWPVCSELGLLIICAQLLVRWGLNYMQWTHSPVCGPHSCLWDPGLSFTLPENKPLDDTGLRRWKKIVLWTLARNYGYLYFLCCNTHMTEL